MPHFEDFILMPSDTMTHLSDFRTACEIAKEHAEVIHPDINDVSYWEKQIVTLDRIMTVMEDLADKVDELDSELHAAVRVAYNHGAKDWVRLNYPKQFERFEHDSRV